MSDIFQLRSTNPPRDKYKMNLEVPKNQQIKFGKKELNSIRYQDMKIFTALHKVDWKSYNV